MSDMIVDSHLQVYPWLQQLAYVGGFNMNKQNRLKLIVAPILVVISMGFVEEANARSLNKFERFLASGRGLWFEADWDGDQVCYLYDFKKGTPAHLRVTKQPYSKNIITGECRFSLPLAPSLGGVGHVNKRVLTIRWPSGYVEKILLVQYLAQQGYMRIFRNLTNYSWWLKLN